MKSLDYYFKKADKENFAIGQFNFSTFEVLKAIILAAKEMRSPVIVGTSQNEANFFGMEEAVSLVNIYKRRYNVPVFLNLDHCRDISMLKKAVKLGYNTCHFDGSKLDYEKNLKETKKASRICYAKNIPLEAELGYIPGASKIIDKIPDIQKTDVKLFESFISSVKLQRVAVSVGSFHGISKKGKPKLDFDLIKKLYNISNGKCYLVLHGASGIPDKDIKKAIKFGIRKVNFNTEIRILYKNSLLKNITSTKEVAPYKYLPAVIEQVKNLIKEKIKILGSYNKK